MTAPMNIAIPRHMSSPENVAALMVALTHQAGLRAQQELWLQQLLARAAFREERTWS